MKIHKLSDVKTNKIGKGTVIWQYCVIMKGVKIGKNCNIGSHSFLEKDIEIGDRVTIKNGSKLFSSMKIEDDVFIGPNVTFTNDRYPRSIRNKNKKILKFPQTVICKGASVGGGSTILPGIKIGKKSIIGAGSIITKDVKAGSIIYGEQAKHKRDIKKINK